MMVLDSFAFKLKWISGWSPQLPLPCGGPFFNVSLSGCPSSSNFPGNGFPCTILSLPQPRCMLNPPVIQMPKPRGISRESTKPE